MCEIIALIAVFRGLAKMAETKGRSKGWGMLGVGFWFGGEVFGAIIGALVGLDGYEVLVIAYPVAILGAGVAWVVVKSLPAAPGSQAVAF